MFRVILFGVKMKYLNISVIGIGREVIQGCSRECVCDVEGCTFLVSQIKLVFLESASFEALLVHDSVVSLQ